MEPLSLPPPPPPPLTVLWIMDDGITKATAERAGVSFFEPDPHLGDAVHRELMHLVGEGQLCYVTVPNMGESEGSDLKLAIGDEEAVVVCGRHRTLFNQPIATALPRAAAARGEDVNFDFDFDDSRMPFDRLTYAVVMALEELVDTSDSPATRMFAWLYSKHLRAADVAFAELLQIPAIANMAATALDAWFVRHPVFKAQAHEAQDLLATVLEDYTPTRPRYEPYWVSGSLQWWSSNEEATRKVGQVVGEQ